MAELLLVNPRRRKRRKMSALQRKYFGKRGARASNPKKRHRRRRHPAMGYTVGSRKIRRRKLNPHRRRHSRSSLVRHAVRRRRNPSLRGVTSGVMPMLKSGLVGATGALGLDLLWGYTKQYLPATIAGSAMAQYAAKLVGAMLVGFVGNKVLRGRGRDLAIGASTVVIHDALKAQMQASFPSLPMGEYLSIAPAMGTTQRAGRFLSTGVGEYLNGLPNAEDDGTYSGDFTSDSINGF